MRVSSKLKLTISQINGLRSFIEKTDDKLGYRRAVSVFKKAGGKTYYYIAREHRVHIRTTKKLIGDYIKEGIEGLKISKNHGDRRKRVMLVFEDETTTIT